MRKLETFDWWPDLLAQKDRLSLRELAQQFSVTPGAISAALRRTNTSRVPAAPGPKPAGDAQLSAARGARAAARAARPPASDPAAPRTVEPRPIVKLATVTARDQAWQVVFRSDRGEETRIVVAPSLVDAAQRAAQVGTVVNLTWLGEMLA